MNEVRSLDNAEIIRKVQEWQAAGFVHELTCAVDSWHASLVAVERDGLVRLECPTCGYQQAHIPDVVFSDYVPHMAKLLEGVQ